VVSPDFALTSRVPPQRTPYWRLGESGLADERLPEGYSPLV